MKRFLMNTISFRSSAIQKLAKAPILASKMICQTPVKGYAEVQHALKNSSSNYERFYNFSGKLKLATVLFTKNHREIAIHYNEYKANFGIHDYLDLIVIMFSKKVTGRNTSFQLDIITNMHKEIRIYLKTNLDELISKDGGAFAILLYGSLFNPYFGKDLSEKIINTAIKDYETNLNSFNFTKRILYLIGFNSWPFTMKKPYYSSFINLKESLNKTDLISKHFLAKFISNCEKNALNDYFVSLLTYNLSYQTEFSNFQQRIDNILLISEVVEVHNIIGQENKMGMHAQLTKIREASEEYDSTSILKCYRALNILKASNMKLKIYSEMNMEILDIIAFTFKHLTENIKSSFLFEFIEQLGNDLELEEIIPKSKEEVATEIINYLVSFNDLISSTNMSKMLILRPIYSLKLPNSDKIEKFLLKLIDIDFIRAIKIKENYLQVKYVSTLSNAISDKYVKELSEYIRTLEWKSVRGAAMQIQKIHRINFTKELNDQLNEFMNKFIEDNNIKKLHQSDRFWLALLNNESQISQEHKYKIIQTVFQQATLENSTSIQDYFYFISLGKHNMPEITQFLESLKRNNEFMINLPFSLQNFYHSQKIFATFEDHYYIKIILIDIFKFCKANQEMLKDPKYKEFYVGLLKLTKFLIEFNLKSYDAYEAEIRILITVFNQYLDEDLLLSIISMNILNEFVRDLSTSKCKFNFHFILSKINDNVAKYPTYQLFRNDFLKNIIFLHETTDSREPKLAKLNSILAQNIISVIEAELVVNSKRLGKQLLLLKIIDNIATFDSFYEKNKVPIDKFLVSLVQFGIDNLNSSKTQFHAIIDILNVLITCDSVIFTGVSENFKKIGDFIDALLNSQFYKWINKIEVSSNFFPNRTSIYLSRVLQNKYLETKSFDIRLANILAFLKLCSKLSHSIPLNELSSKISSDIIDNLEEIKTHKLNLKFIDALSKCHIGNNFIYKKLISDTFKHEKAQLGLLVCLFCVKKTELFDFSALNESMQTYKHLKFFKNSYEKIVYSIYLYSQPSLQKISLPLIEKIMNSIHISDLIQIKSINEWIVCLIAIGLVKDIKIKDQVRLYHIYFFKFLNKINESYSKLCQEKEKYQEVIKRIEDLNLGFTPVTDNQVLHCLVNEKENIKAVLVNSLRNIKPFNSYAVQFLEEQDQQKHKFIFLNVQFLRKQQLKDTEIKDYFQKFCLN